MPTCPNGHRSAAEDWCEECARHAASGTAPPPPAPGSAMPPPEGGGAHGRPCPRCRAPREEGASFCAECRHDFSVQPPPAAPPASPGSPPQPHGSEGWPVPPPATPAAFPQHGRPPYAAPPPPRQPPAAPPPPQAPPPFPQQQPPRPREGDWTVTIGPDRAYFTAMMRRSGPEAAGLTLPAYAPEQRMRLSGSRVTIGRRRQSTGESPDIDLALPPEDPGVSHQHAMLVRQDGGGWAVVDQDSTNGTTVNGGEEPIRPFVPVPLGEGDRVHVGAWTTIVLHRS